MNEAREVDGAAVVAGSEPAKVFEAIEASFDLVAVLVDGDVMRDEDLSIALGRDHDFGFHPGDDVS